MMNVKHERDIINYALRNFNADYESVKKKPVIHGMNWTEYYWDDDKSKAEFKAWLVRYVKKHFKVYKKRAESIAGWLDLFYGLKLYYK